MERKRYSAEYLRRCIWRCLDISVSATIPDMVAGIEGIGFDSVKKALRQLEIHGYVVKSVGKRGGHRLYVKGWRVAVLPVVCGCCKGAFATKTCDPLQREREREKERERMRPSNNADWHRVPDELKTRLERQLNNVSEVPDDAV